jgi:hypothetical protein
MSTSKGTSLARLQDDDSDSRSAVRSNVFLAAILDTGVSTLPVRIRNLSSTGALVEGATLPALGTRVRVLRGRLNASGELAWEGDGQVGIRFDRAIVVKEWVERVGHVKIDETIAPSRQEGNLGETEAVRPGSLQAIAAALDEVRAQLAILPELPVEVREELVKLDVIAQSLGDLATVR